MKTTDDILKETDVSKSTIYFHAKQLGIKKTGRDFHFTNAQAKQILAKIGSRPGPKAGSKRRKAA